MTQKKVKSIPLSKQKKNLAYKIRVTDTAKKQLKKLDRQTAIRIDKKLHEISNDPFPHITKLVGLEFYKLRVGDYRILMTIQQNNLIIMVVEISHRRNIYKQILMELYGKCHTVIIVSIKKHLEKHLSNKPVLEYHE